MARRSSKDIVGGGTKKILYALRTAQRTGLISTTRALNSRNTCKACGLGMGGQRGGMTNELGEFPSVCNKSIQAQSTDIQPPIPESVLTHALSEFRELDGHELEHLGRLGTPIHKAADADRFRVVDWEFAFDRAVGRLAACDPQRVFFYSSGRSSNEAGFLLQLLARAYGTNHVNNCSYYCHQATNAGLASTIGTGTASVELSDLGLCDLIFVIGANPASNHPRFIHQLKACRDRGGQVVVLNPAREPGLVRFALPRSPGSLLRGGDWIASAYLQPRIGSDIALFKGLAKAVIAAGAHDNSYIVVHTSGFEAYRADLDATPWAAIETRTGLTRAAIEEVASLYARSTHAVFAWGMGITHHLHGVDNVESIAALALLRGMIGKPGAGLLPLRGHSNVQGIGTIGVKPVLPAEVLGRMQEALGLELPTTPGYDTMSAMQAASRGEIDAAVLMGGNLLDANPDARFAEAAFNRIGFKLFLTTTLNRGHVAAHDSSEVLVLPVTARDEEWEPTTQESMFNYVRLSDGGISRLANVRPETAILGELGRRLLPDGPVDFAEFSRHRHIRQAIASVVPGLEALADIDVAKREFHVRGRLLHKPEFRTSDGKARFIVRAIPPGPGPGLILSTIRSEGQFNTIVYERTDSYRFGADRTTVLLHADDLAANDLRDGDTATLESAQGRMANVTVRAFDVARGSVLAYFPEANVLTGTEVDPRSRTPSFKATKVWFVR